MTNLHKESGQTAARRIEEAIELLNKLDEASAGDSLDGKNREFYLSMMERYDEDGEFMHVSPKQLFWLRDLVNDYT